MSKILPLFISLLKMQHSFHYLDPELLKAYPSVSYNQFLLQMQGTGASVVSSDSQILESITSASSSSTSQLLQSTCSNNEPVAKRARRKSSSASSSEPTAEDETAASSLLSLFTSKTETDSAEAAGHLHLDSSSGENHKSEDSALYSKAQSTTAIYATVNDRCPDSINSTPGDGGGVCLNADGEG